MRAVLHRLAGSVGRVPPGIASLTDLLTDHCEAVEFDLQHYHQTDVRDLWTGRLTYRRLGVLIKHLPAESATKTELRNAAPVEVLKQAAVSKTYGPWSQTDMLLAELIDQASWLKWSKTKDAENGTNLPPPYPRPGVKRADEPVAQTAMGDVIDLFEYMKQHNGASPPGFVGA